MGWYHPCVLVRRARESDARRGYDEPTVMWSTRRADGLLSHVVIGRRGDGAVVVWFLNDRPVGLSRLRRLDQRTPLE